MMASDRPASLPITDPAETPLDAPPPIPSDPTPTPARGMLKPSPFLNGFDLVLALGTIVLGFAIASFAIKNSEFWLHIGTGRLIAQGQYEFGKAPFTYSGADRHWTNHAWLYDLGTYSLFNAAGGKAIAIFKALLIAGLVTLLLLIRRPGQSLWLGVLIVGLALMTAAPYLEMQPSILSCGFLGLTLYMLLKSPAKPDCWKLPIGIGIAFWLWANCDQWFFLGPVVLALYLIGELVQRKISAEAADEALPSLKTLAIALGIGVIACMLNPHHVRIWQLPAEMFPGQLKTILAKEPDISYLFRNLFDKETLDVDGSHDGNPVNAFSFFILVSLNILGFALNFRRILASLVLVNVAMLALAILHARALPFYAIAAAPISALNLGQAISAYRERTYKLGTLHALVAGRVGARMGLFTAGAVALVAAYPGWLHPISADRRLTWSVEPDPTLTRAAQALKRLRDDGKIPAEAQSLTLNPDLAHYCAWYAPAERSFFDLRLGLHAPDAEAFAKLRSLIHVRPKNEAKPAEFDVSRFLTERKITHFVVSAADRQEVLDTMTRMLASRRGNAGAVEQPWELWDLHGKAAIAGWSRQKVLTPEQFQALRYAPIAFVNDPNTPSIADLESIAPPEKRGLIEKFASSLPATSPDSDESFLLNLYQAIRLSDEQAASRERIIASIQAFFAVTGTSVALVAPIAPFSQLESSFPLEIRALAILNVRTARRGILESPAAAEGYLALANGYAANAWTGWSETRKDFLIVANLERYIARLTPEQMAKSDQSVFNASLELYQRHKLAKRLDLAVEALRRSLVILRAKSATASKAVVFAETIRQFEAELKQSEKAHRDQENIWLNNIAGAGSPIERVSSAEKLGLYRKALQELNSVVLGDSSKLQPEAQLGILFERIQLDLLTGQVEEAEAIVRELDESRPELMSHPELGQVFLERKFDTMFLLGRFSEATALLAQDGSDRRASLDVARKSAEFTQIVGAQVVRKLGMASGISLTELLTMFRPPLYELQLRKYVGALAGQEQIHLKLALTYLEQGNNKSATNQFEETIKAAKHRILVERGLFGVDSFLQAESPEAMAKSYLALLNGKPRPGMRKPLP